MTEFVPCPFCKQYSHSIGGDQLAAAFMVFQSMWSHRDDGIPTRYCFDERARDAAQVLMTAASAASRIEAQRGETGTGSISEADESLTLEEGDAQTPKSVTKGA